jgi:acetyltransferase-like isoleucine patch superfamily enzyme
VSLLRRPLNRLVHAVRRWVDATGAIQPGTDLAESFGTFGAGSFIAYPTGTLFGQRAIHLGEGTLIGAHCTLLVGYSPDEDPLPERGLVIGDRCVIGAGATITAHASIEIGDDVWFGRDVFVSDASHGYQDPETPIGVQLGAKQPVSIGAGSWIGHGAMILPGTTIGRQVVVGAGSVVRGTVEDHAVVAGVPAKVVRRLEPGIGWVPTSGSADVRPAWTAAEVAAMLADPRPGTN